MKNIFVLSPFLFCISALIAQVKPENEFCGTPHFMPRTSDFIQTTPSISSRSGDILYIPVTINILGDDNGKGYFSAEEAIDMVCGLQTDFQEYGFHFYIEGDFNYINNSTFYDMDPDYRSSEDQNLFLEENNTLNTLNIYIVEDAGGGNYLAGDCLFFDNNTFPPIIKAEGRAEGRLSAFVERSVASSKPPLCVLD